MATRYGLNLSSRCANCHQTVLRSFISSLATPAIHTSQRPRQFTKRFGTSARNHNENDRLEGNDAQSLEQKSIPQSSADSPVTSASSDTGTPWYLQVKEQHDLQDAQENPFAERQRLPELPSDPPPMLQDLLKHISLDIGLDYLTLLDLRKMDPPPALGNNLLMIFGTARSERHLNVSADRLCRWLRTTYKLRPVADGLLGRNELKLKLRRKNRRSKMLGAAGATDPGNYDDGIHTGWICVNVGSVDGPIEQMSDTSEADQDGIVGFGHEDQRPKIVIQMLTEEKRGEVELENLWQTALNRSLRREKAQLKAVEEEAAIKLETDGSRDGDPSHARDSIKAGNGPLAAASRSFQPQPGHLTSQIRSIHTSRHFAAIPEEPDEYELEPHLMERSPALTSALSNARPFPMPPADDEANVSNLQLDGSARALRTSLDFLYRQERHTAIRELGSGENDRSSTSFLSTFNSNMPVFLEEHHWRCIINLHAHAIKIGHSGYTRPGLIRQMRRMHSSLAIIPEDILMNILTALLHNQLVVFPGSKGVPNKPATAEQALRQSLALAFEVLEKMDAYGYNVCSDEVFLALHYAISHPSFVSDVELSHTSTHSVTAAISSPESNVSASSALSFPLVAQDRYNYHLRQAMKILNPGPLSHRVYSSLLKTYAAQGQWHSFWSVWRDMPRQMVNRTADMYVTAFRGTAEANSQSFAQRTMKEIVPQMAQESPPVEMKGDLAIAVGECLEVAQFDPAEPFQVGLSKRLELALNDHLLQQWAEQDKSSTGAAVQPDEFFASNSEGESKKSS